jgi:hypothetical protein
MVLIRVMFRRSPNLVPISLRGRSVFKLLRRLWTIKAWPAPTSRIKQSTTYCISISRSEFCYLFVPLLV